MEYIISENQVVGIYKALMGTPCPANIVEAIRKELVSKPVEKPAMTEEKTEEPK